jgi:hypothetical protein
MVSRIPEISPVQYVRNVLGPYFRRAIYPTPPPFSSYAPENNNVTAKKLKTTLENKQLTDCRHA